MARISQAGIGQAGPANPIRQRIQLAAIARVRWQVFTHSIRTKGGALEFASRIFVSLLLTVGGLGALHPLRRGRLRSRFHPYSLIRKACVSRTR